MMLLLAGCATVRDVDGNHYKTLKINGMQWMVENLRTTHYADGTPIAKASPDSKDMEQPLYYDRFEQLDSTKKYGLLYNWFTAVHSTASDSSEMLQGVCRWLASAFGERMGYAFHRQCCAKYAHFLPAESSEIPAAIARWLQSSEWVRGVGARVLLVELGPLDRRHRHGTIREFPQLSLPVRLFRRCGKRLQRAVCEGQNTTATFAKRPKTFRKAEKRGEIARKCRQSAV